MAFILEFIKFVFFSLVIVYVSKNVLVKLLRKISEIFDLSPKKVGEIAGFSTSMPELLTVFFSAIQGLFSAGIYNIISSNVINFVQYIASIKINKNEKVLKNRALKIELFMIVLTIAIPIIMIITKIATNITIVPIFVLLFVLFYYVKGNVYKVYNIRNMGENERRKIEEEKKWVKNKKRLAIITGLELLGVGVILFIIGNMLGNTLDNLNSVFNIPQIVIGIILGFVTSIPEFITFIEAQRHHGKDANDVQGVIEATSNLFTSNTLNLFIIESIGIVTYWIISLR